MTREQMERTLIKQILMERSEAKKMTKVICEFKECIYNQGNECTKDKIRLDENVSNIDIGCLDAIWEESEVEE